jgi:hypothetical protein
MPHKQTMCCNCGVVRATYGSLENRKPQWCRACKPSDAIDVVHKRCICGLARPTFGLIGNIRPTFCVNCPTKPPEAVDLISKMCMCGRSIASFGVPGNTSSRYCKLCPQKSSDAVNLHPGKLCECKKTQAKFAMRRGMERKWCSLCKPEGAIDVSRKLCACGKKRPTLGLETDTGPRWCEDCPQKDPRAAKTERCIECKKSGRSKNLPGQPVRYCYGCAKTGMITYPMKKCERCKSLALYGGHDSVRLRCEEHKLLTDFNLVERPCKNCGLEEVLNAHQLCGYCEPATFLTFTKRKENRIRDMFSAHKLEFVQDKTVDSKCGKERPDFLFDVLDVENGLDHVVIVEVDEDQHKSYEYQCDDIRMFNLTQAFGGRKVFWIRYNPDAFQPKVSVTQAQREAHLLEWVLKAMKRKPVHLAEVVYLYYDECKATTPEKDIMPLIQFEKEAQTEVVPHILPKEVTQAKVLPKEVEVLQTTTQAKVLPKEKYTEEENKKITDLCLKKAWKIVLTAEKRRQKKK